MTCICGGHIKLKSELQSMKGGSDAIISTMDNIIIIDEIMRLLSFVMVVQTNI